MSSKILPSFSLGGPDYRRFSASLYLENIFQIGLSWGIRAACLLRHLFFFGVAAIQKIYFLCNVEVCVSSGDFVVHSTYENRLAKGVSLLVKHNMDMRLDIVHVDAGGDCGWYYREMCFVSLFASNKQTKRSSFLFSRGRSWWNPNHNPAHLILTED